jgi:serine/arginine repetitive matrix protein 2
MPASEWWLEFSSPRANFAAASPSPRIPIRRRVRSRARTTPAPKRDSRSRTLVSSPFAPGLDLTRTRRADAFTSLTMLSSASSRRLRSGGRGPELRARRLLNANHSLHASSPRRISRRAKRPRRRRRPRPQAPTRLRPTRRSASSSTPRRLPTTHRSRVARRQRSPSALPMCPRRMQRSRRRRRRRLRPRSHRRSRNHSHPRRPRSPSRDAHPPWRLSRLHANRRALPAGARRPSPVEEPAETCGAQPAGGGPPRV